MSRRAAQCSIFEPISHVGLGVVRPLAAVGAIDSSFADLEGLEYLSPADPNARAREFLTVFATHQCFSNFHPQFSCDLAPPELWRGKGALNLEHDVFFGLTPFQALSPSTKATIVPQQRLRFSHVNA
jgi:hypothetical protein